MTLKRKALSAEEILILRCGSPRQVAKPNGVPLGNGAGGEEFPETNASGSLCQRETEELLQGYARTGNSFYLNNFHIMPSCALMGAEWGKDFFGKI